MDAVPVEVEGRDFDGGEVDGLFAVFVFERVEVVLFVRSAESAPAAGGEVGGMEAAGGAGGGWGAVLGVFVGLAFFFFEVARVEHGKLMVAALLLLLLVV